MSNISSLYVFKEQQNPPDRISVDVQLFIRLLEWAREESGADVPLHVVAENASKLCAERGNLTMQDYEDIMSNINHEE